MNNIIDKKKDNRNNVLNFNDFLKEKENENNNNINNDNDDNNESNKEEYNNNKVKLKRNEDNKNGTTPEEVQEAISEAFKSSSIKNLLNNNNLFNKE